MSRHGPLAWTGTSVDDDEVLGLNDKSLIDRPTRMSLSCGSIVGPTSPLTSEELGGH
jgi:hypothetical protein